MFCSQEVLPGDKVSLEGIYEGISDYKGTIPGDQSFIARMLRSVQKEGPDKGKPLSDEQIASNAIGVILAGNNNLTWQKLSCEWDSI